jgi:hypothetical protein
VRPGGQEVSISLERNREWDQMDRKCLCLSNESGSETWRSESVQISRTKLGVRPGDQEVSTSLEQNWEWGQVVRMCPHLSNETGSETRWSGSVHISKNETGSETWWSGSVQISRTKLGVRPGYQKVSQSLERNWEWDQVVRKCLHLSNITNNHLNLYNVYP